jgi:hypothetical protein
LPTTKSYRWQRLLAYNSRRYDAGNVKPSVNLIVLRSRQLPSAESFPVVLVFCFLGLTLAVLRGGHESFCLLRPTLVRKPEMTIKFNDATRRSRPKGVCLAALDFRNLIADQFHFAS